MRIAPIGVQEATVISFTINGRPQQVDVSPDAPLLWVIAVFAATGTRIRRLPIDRDQLKRA